MDEDVHDTEAAGLLLLDRLARDEAVLYARRAQQLVASARASAEQEAAGAVPRFLLLDLAGTLRTGQRGAENQLAEATRLVEDFPMLLGQLWAGAVHVVQARRVLQHTWAVSPAVAREVDRRLQERLWSDPSGWVGARLTREVSRVVLQSEADLEPDAVARRQQEARAGRRVSVRTEPDGMGSLWALLPADRLVVFARGLEALAARQKVADRVAGVVRTADQRRADVLASLPELALHALTSGSSSGGPGGGPAGACRHPRVVLDVQVPMATLLGHSNAPGTLSGYGLLGAGDVRLLLPDAYLRQVLVDGETGQVLHADRTLVPPVRPATSRRPAAARAGRRGSRRSGSSSGERRRLSEVPVSGATDACDGTGATPASGTTGAPGPVTTPSIQWLGGPEEHPERLVAHLCLPSSEGARTAPNVAAASPPSPQDRARLARLVPSDVLVLEDWPEERYRPSAALRRLLRLRDELCTGPGCATSCARCDLDHADPWPHGPTNAGNMRPHSRRCHRAKTCSWTTRRDRHGTLHWTSPTGRTYRVPPLWQPAPPLEALRPDPVRDPGARAGERKPERFGSGLADQLEQQCPSGPPGARPVQGQLPPPF